MRALRRTSLGLLLLATAARADVLVVDAAGGGDHVDLQEAVDTATDGDVLLIRDGAYAAPLLAGRALTLVADRDAHVRLDGVTDVLAVSAEQLLILSGLELTGRQFSPALRVTACGGPVRIQDCHIVGADGPAFVGGDGAPGQFAAGPGVCIHACDDVAFVRCTVRGGAGGEHAGGSAPGTTAGTGRDALEASAAILTLERCTLIGGAGGAAPFGGLAGTPGAGLSHFGLELIAARCEVRGGAGGAGTLGCSDGAPGVRLAGSDAWELGCTLLGGAAGGAGCIEGASAEGQLSALRGAQRGLVAPRVVDAGQPVVLDLFGRPGDTVRLYRATETARLPRLAAGGVWMLAGSAVRLPPVGPLPGSGHLTLPLDAPSVAPGDAALLLLQAVHEPVQGAPTLSNATIVVVIGV